MRAGVALLALAAAARAQGGAAANASNASVAAAAVLPPHTGGAAGAYRPLILFHDSFFGREFVHREYAFEARACLSAFVVGSWGCRLR